MLYAWILCTYVLYTHAIFTLFKLWQQKRKCFWLVQIDIFRYINNSTTPDQQEYTVEADLQGFSNVFFSPRPPQKERKACFSFYPTGTSACNLLFISPA